MPYNVPAVCAVGAESRWHAAPRTERSEGRGVFALVVRCRIIRLLLYSRVGKNRDTRRESAAGAGADRTAEHLTVLFSQKILAVRSANDIYRPVMQSCYFATSNWRLLVLSNQVIHPILSS
jgi:hypothetical protein